MKSAAILIALMCIPAPPLLVGGEKPKAAEPQKAVALTEEEKQMLKDRELLENLELLKGLDKFQYMDLFTAQDQNQESQSTPAKKKTEKKK